MREVVTLQFGAFSNHVATHYWNLTHNADEAKHQEKDESVRNDKGPQLPELDGDVLFHRGRDDQGRDTYCPRTVIFDKKGSLGALSELTGEIAVRSTNIDRSRPPDLEAWGERTSLCQTSSYRANDFQKLMAKQQSLRGDARGFAEPHSRTAIELRDRPLWKTDAGNLQQPRSSSSGRAPPALDGKVNFWPDFLKVRLHPRSTHLLAGVHENATAFHSFGRGAACMERSEEVEEMLDRVRYFVEASDWLQGFHILCDTTDSFGGLASCFLEELRDDYKNPMLAFPVAPLLPSDLTNAARVNAICNTSLTLDALLEHASYVVPLDVNRWNIPNLALKLDTTQQFHLSAVAGAALNTATIGHRLRRDPASAIPVSAAHGTLGELSKALRVKQSMKIGHMFSSFPLRRSLPPVVEFYPGRPGRKKPETDLRRLGVVANLTRPYEQLEPSDKTVGVTQKRQVFAESLALQGFNCVPEDDRKWIQQALNIREDRPVPRTAAQAMSPINIPVAFPFRDQLRVSEKTACTTFVSSSTEVTGLLGDAIGSVNTLRERRLPGAFLDATPQDRLAEIKERYETLKDIYSPYES